MRNYCLYICFTFILSAILFSCKKSDEGPSADDNILNYEIPEIAVTANYTVGAFYYSFGSFNANITEVPAVGKYSMPNGVLSPTIMAKHIEYATKGGLDYFVFSFRSANRDANNYRNDSTLIKGFLDANTASSMKFALAYNFSTGTYGINTSAPLENDANKLEQFFRDIEKVAPFMGNNNYQKVNGKPLLYIMNAQVLYSNNNIAIYDTLRSRMSAKGLQLYIVGMQERWSPPGRYPFRFQRCVDAIYHQSYSAAVNEWDRFYLLPQAMDQNWKYSKQFFADHYGVDYVPNISPAYNWKILNPASLNPNIARADNGALYRQLCNVAKMNASSSTRLILIDAFNKWDEDMQLEPGESYGELYLEITKREFKR